MLERGAALACFLRSHARILTVRSKFFELQRRDMIASSVWSPRTDAHTVASVVLSVCVTTYVTTYITYEYHFPLDRFLLLTASYYLPLLTTYRLLLS